MTPAEILKSAADARPDLIEKVAKALYVLERTDETYAAELAADIDEITNHTTEKVAAAGATARSVALGVGGALGAGLAAAVATDLYDAAKRGLTKGTNYKRMMTANPELKQFGDKSLHQSFNTVHRYAPEMTADPMVAAQLVRGLAVSPENSAAFVKELLQARKALADAKGQQFKMTNISPINVTEPQPGGAKPQLTGKK